MDSEQYKDFDYDPAADEAEAPRRSAAALKRKPNNPFMAEASALVSVSCGR